MSTIPEVEHNHESPRTSPPIDAKKKMVEFDWEDLESRFHKEMESCNKEDVKLYDELNSLISVSELVPMASTLS